MLFFSCIKRQNSVKNLSFVVSCSFDYQIRCVTHLDGSPPTVTVSTPDVTVYIGDDATLECDATGKPAPVFSWMQRGRHQLSNVNTWLHAAN